MSKIYEVEITTKENEVKKIEDYKGKTLLIVNTATACGFTPQFEGLQSLYAKYAEQGLEILDFPCNQFWEQAKESDEEITAFCKGRFGVTFPQFKKIDVKGERAAPIYNYLLSLDLDTVKTPENEGFYDHLDKAGLLDESEIRWNFEKFLVNKDGVVLKRYDSTVEITTIEQDLITII